MIFIMYPKPYFIYLGGLWVGAASTGEFSAIREVVAAAWLTDAGKMYL